MKLVYGIMTAGFLLGFGATAALAQSAGGYSVVTVIGADGNPSSYVDVPDNGSAVSGFSEDTSGDAPGASGSSDGSQEEENDAPDNY